MMRISCNVIEDLLPIYLDGVCSQETKDLIEEHLKECENCKSILDALKNTDICFENEEVQAAKKENKIFKKGLKKVKRRVASVVVAGILILCLLGANGVMIYHEVSGDGICYSNIREVYTVKSFFRAIQKGNYEKAAKMIDYDSEYKYLVDALITDGELNSSHALEYYEELPNMTEESYRSYKQERMINSLQEFGESGDKITDIKYYAVYRIKDAGNAVWQVEFTVRTAGAEATSAVYIFHVRDGKISYSGGMFPEQDHEKQYALEDALVVFFSDELEDMYE